MSGSTWVRIDLELGDRIKGFSVSQRQVAILGYPWNAWEHPEVIAEWVDDLIHRIHPEWPGAYVVSVQGRGMSIVFYIAHESFLRVPFIGPWPDPEPLLIEERVDMPMVERREEEDPRTEVQQRAAMDKESDWTIQVKDCANVVVRDVKEIGLKAVID